MVSIAMLCPTRSHASDEYPAMNILIRGGSLTAVRLSILVLLLLGGCFDSEDSMVEFSGNTMGTTYHVKIAAPPRGLDVSVMQQKVDVELARLNSLMSTWDPNSQISQFNLHNGTNWIEMAPETIQLIRIAKRISKETEGAYDITLGSVSKLWGFQQVGSTGPIADDLKPDLDEILTLLYSVGHQLLQESRDGLTIRKLAADLQVDLSSIAKGFAVDRLGEMLEAEGANRYIAEIGGEIRSRGLAADGERWKVGIEWPVSGVRNVSSGVLIENAHLATSGDYRNYREIDGKRYTHLIDGRTGYPVSHKLASVTVLHGSVAQADAWATAFMVLGLDEAVAIANRKGLAVRFTVRENDSFKVYMTKPFEAYSFIQN